MAIPVRCICGRTRSFSPGLWTQLKQHQSTRTKYSSSIAKDIHHVARDDDQQDTRENAIQARLPCYNGWWTEVMNYQQVPQSLPDPTLLLSEGHVFQGQPASQTMSSTPTASGAKKGYSNTLPTADTRKTAVSKGSASFATGTPSSLSQPTAQSTPYHGFWIPVKPTPPGAEDCCMR
jgi:hypothetical protein